MVKKEPMLRTFSIQRTVENQLAAN